MRISDWSSDVCSSDLEQNRKRCAKRCQRQFLMPMESVRIVPDTNKERGQVYLISGFFRPSAWAMGSSGRSEWSGVWFDDRVEGIDIMTQYFPALVEHFMETLKRSLMDEMIKR